MHLLREELDSVQVEHLTTQESVLKDLKQHLAMVNGIGHGAGAGGDHATGSEVKPDKFPGPEISGTTTDTDWKYFKDSWAS